MKKKGSRLCFVNGFLSTQGNVGDAGVPGFDGASVNTWLSLCYHIIFCDNVVWIF